MYQKTKQTSSKRETKNNICRLFNTNRYIHLNVKVCSCVTITIIQNIWLEKWNCISFLSKLYVFVLRFAVQFSQLRQLPLKAFIRPLHTASMQKTNCAGADPTPSSSCGQRDDALLEDIRHVRPLMTPNSCTSPAPQRPHSLWISYLDSQSTTICC